MGLFSSLFGGASKKQKKSYEQGSQDIQGQYQQAADTWGGRGTHSYDYGTGTQNFVGDELRNLYGNYDDMFGGGGGVPGYGGEFDQYKDWYDKLRDTGNWGPMDQRAEGIAKEFGETGGVTPEMAYAMRERPAAQQRSLFGQLRQDLARKGRVQGGWGTGMGAADLQARQDLSKSLREGTLGAEESIGNMTRQGRMWGGEQSGKLGEEFYGRTLTGQQGGLGLAEQISNINRSSAAANAGSRERGFGDRLRLLGAMRENAGDTYGIPYGEMQYRGIGGASEENARRYGYAQSQPGMFQRIGQGFGALGKAFKDSSPTSWFD